MDNKMVMAGIVVFLSIAIVGVLGLKKGGFLGENKPATNWQWEDQWPNGTPQQQPSPQQPPQAQPNTPTQPKGQITASTFAQAKQLSQQHNRRILVMFTADWCSWCQKMKNETLTNAQVKAAMQKYVFVMVDTDKDSATGSKFGVRGLPTFVITDSSEQKHKSASGYQDANKFVGFLN